VSRSWRSGWHGVGWPHGSSRWDSRCTSTRASRHDPIRIRRHRSRDKGSTGKAGIHDAAECPECRVSGVCRPIPRVGDLLLSVTRNTRRAESRSGSEDIDLRLKIVLVAVLLALAVWCRPTATRWLAIDRCLDFGGRWGCAASRRRAGNRKPWEGVPWGDRKCTRCALPLG